jgi:hypothetical protein
MIRDHEETWVVAIDLVKVADHFQTNIELVETVLENNRPGGAKDDREEIEMTSEKR